MNFLELAKARYSVRSFKKDPIEAEKLAKMNAELAARNASEASSESASSEQ